MLRASNSWRMSKARCYAYETLRTSARKALVDYGGETQYRAIILRSGKERHGLRGRVTMGGGGGGVRVL